MVNIEATKKTPEITFDPDKGYMSMKGRSVPEDATKFFASLERGWEFYKEYPQPTTQVDIALEYFNTSTSAFLLRLFNVLLEINKSDSTSVQVNWLYEQQDEEMLDAGNDFKLMIKELPLETRAVERFDFRDAQPAE